MPQPTLPVLPLWIVHPWNRYLVRRIEVRADRLADVALIAAALRKRIATHELN